MKAAQNTGLMYILLIVIQMLITNYCQFTPYLTLSILPVMVLCLPLSIGTVWAMIIAFSIGLGLDLLTEGLLGLTAFALVPVAAVRQIVIQLFLGKEIIDRKDSLSFRKNGVPKISASIVVLQTIFLIFYIIVDGAGTRPFWFNAVKFLISLIVGYLVALLVARALIPDEKN